MKKFKLTMSLNSRETLMRTGIFDENLARELLSIEDYQAINKLEVQSKYAYIDEDGDFWQRIE